MTQYRKSYLSHVDVNGCHLAFAQAIKACGWTMLRSADTRRLACREPNERGEWEENLVTVEILLDFAPNKMTRIDMMAGSSKTGEAAYEYARHQADGLIRRVETAIRPQKTYAS